MAFILNIETATKNCSVALAQHGTLISVREIAGEGYLHAEKLHLFIGEVISDAGITIQQLDAVAVSRGPGSYTGLRIGVSAAKGLCYALSVPLIAIDTLEVLARKVTLNDGELIAPLIDARRMEVYTAVYNRGYERVSEITAEIIDENFLSKIKTTLHLAGDGAAKCKGLLNGSNIIYHEDAIYPSSAEMCGISYNKYKIGDTVDVAYFEPFYLKDFIAGKS